MTEIDQNIAWADFITKTSDLLLKDQSVDRQSPHIKILFEPSFDNTLFLQLQFEKDKTKWFRSTWVKSTDHTKFYNPIERLKCLNKEILPTIQKDSGELDSIKTKHITDFVRTLRISPSIDKNNAWTLDGCYFTLVIGVESTEVIYKWHTIPEEWKDLQKLADLLADLDVTIK